VGMDTLRQTHSKDTHSRKGGMHQTRAISERLLAGRHCSARGLSKKQVPARSSNSTFETHGRAGNAPGLGRGTGRTAHTISQGRERRTSMTSASRTTRIVRRYHRQKRLHVPLNMDLFDPPDTAGTKRFWSQRQTHGSCHNDIRTAKQSRKHWQAVASWWECTHQ
jgi:hypothetical protein